MYRSAREVASALSVLEYLQQLIGHTDIFDAGFELVRHALLEAWIETSAHDKREEAGQAWKEQSSRGITIQLGGAFRSLQHHK